MKNIVCITLLVIFFIQKNDVRAEAEEDIQNIDNENEVINQNLFPNQEFNQLKWVEVIQNKLSSQIMLDFAQPIYFQKEVDKTKLTLSFPGMELKYFNAHQVIENINKLKNSGLIKQVNVKKGKNKNIPSVELSIVFHKFRTEQTCSINKLKRTKKSKIRNKLLIKWSRTEDPNRIILDIFTKESIGSIKHNDKIIFQGMNNNSFPAFVKKISPVPKNFRIVIDPGHGGDDDGAVGLYGIKEKDIALNIAKKTRKELQNAGYKALLTRGVDQQLTLTDRSELANQLKADLFVSIHVNSISNFRSDVSGIETFYLNNDVLCNDTNSGFISVSSELENQNKYKDLQKIVRTFFRNNNDKSKKLALGIQNKLIQFLNKKKFNVVDRGIKKSIFRLLLRSSVPAALVEVGFITNEKEIKHLSSDYYQNFIAKGICKGIQHSLMET
jgi:N-acetylmuramoyl-L-alanine amidase